jgi:hypothetical protein
MNGRDDFLDQLEDYLDTVEGSTPLPKSVRNAIRAELPGTRQLGPLRGPMRFLLMATNLPRSSRYGLAAAVVAIALIGGASLLVGSNNPATTSSSTPSASAVASASASSPDTAAVDALVTAWNNGDGQAAASLYIAQPTVRFMINSSDISTYATSGAIASAVTAWHADGAVLARTGDVLAQGPYLGCTVTWTSSQGTFNGALVVHPQANGLIESEYLIGATSTVAPGAADGTDVVKGLRDAIHTPVFALALRLGSATPDLYAADFNAWQWEDDTQGGRMPITGQPDVTNLFAGSTQAADSSVDAVETQGPFVLYSASAGDTGFNVLWLTGDGLIQYSWDIRVPMSAPAASPAGG